MQELSISYYICADKKRRCDSKCRCNSYKWRGIEPLPFMPRNSRCSCTAYAIFYKNLTIILIETESEDGFKSISNFMCKPIQK